MILLASFTTKCTIQFYSQFLGPSQSTNSKTECPRNLPEVSAKISENRPQSIAFEQLLQKKCI